MCKPTGYPVSLGISVKPESHRLFQIYLQLLPTNTSHWGNGLRVPASSIAHISTWASPHFPSFPQTSLQVPVQAKQKANLFLSHISWCQAIPTSQPQDAKVGGEMQQIVLPPHSRSPTRWGQQRKRDLNQVTTGIITSTQSNYIPGTVLSALCVLLSSSTTMR